ncbi:protein serine/threonine phosphatase 2C [Obba rivulosa]|uniref:Protein serine/threonine phosphatase 2C n=1 Tax=Obba rivulosa TaxID=1052685 RepID=A0A8E2DGC5_9APHY|nr:protein serine/threonine phosphatase 2C [Obba rivulosa]
MHSGCTAVTAFLRLEDAEGQQSFVPSGFDPLSWDIPTSEDEDEHGGGDNIDASKLGKRKHRLHSALTNLGGGAGFNEAHHAPSTHSQVFTPPESLSVRRVLYCANAGDARGVLCRAGRGIRLTYDHKGSDKQEAKRIMDAGGFVMSGRVNGVLAVTRSLGDSSMKEYVVGAPYTTETELSEEDEFLILACDGLWDVIEDQKAVELVRGIVDPSKAAQFLLEHAYENYSTDNVTVLVVRFRSPPESVRDITA